MPLQAIYPTPIFFGEVDNHKEIEAELDPVLDEIDFQYRDSWGATHYLSDPTFKENLIVKHDLKELKKGIEKNLFEYLGGLFEQPWDDRYRYTITHSWAALFKKGNYGHIHSHGEADIAGVYYHEVPEDSGGLFFEPPAPALCDSLVYSKWGHRLTPRVSEGLMLLFPGFLKHGIETNTTDLDRLSISFNILFDRGDIYGQ